MSYFLISIHHMLQTSNNADSNLLSMILGKLFTLTCLTAKRSDAWWLRR